MKHARSGATSRPLGEDADLTDLYNQVGFLLRLAQLSVFKHLLIELEPFDLRLTDYSALLVIAANPQLKQQSLGEALRIKKPNLVAIIDGLERRGLVERGSVPNDRRSYALTLTPDGADLLKNANAAQARHEAALTEALGPIDRATILDALTRFAEMSGSID